MSNINEIRINFIAKLYLDILKIVKASCVNGGCLVSEFFIIYIDLTNEDFEVLAYSLMNIRADGAVAFQTVRRSGNKCNIHLNSDFDWNRLDKVIEDTERDFDGI